MARPTKEGLDYFPLDIDIDQDDKIAMIEAKYEMAGFGLIIKLLMKIYRHGYYYDWGEQQKLLFVSKNKASLEFVDAVVNDALDWGFFNKELFDKFKILTSRGIQKRYIKCAERRAEIKIISDFILIDLMSYSESDRTRIKVIDNINLINEYNNYSNGDAELYKSTQRKVKKRESKVKNIKNTIPPLFEWVKNYCEERQNNVNPQKWFDHYTSKGWLIGKVKMVDWQAAVRTWEKLSVTEEEITPETDSRRKGMPHFD